MSFPASNGGYVQICKSQNIEQLLEAMQRIFEYVGKVPVRILFDNMSSAVVKTLPKRERKLTDTFSRFALHHRLSLIFADQMLGRRRSVCRIWTEGTIEKTRYLLKLLKSIEKSDLLICDEWVMFLLIVLAQNFFLELLPIVMKEKSDHYYKP